MQLYDQLSFEAAASVTKAYSTSFSAATRLFPHTVQPHIYNIYGLVRVADEIVDSYEGKDAPELLDNLESEVYQSIKTGYSSNLIVHAFAQTAREFGIDKNLVAPFFASMRADLTEKTFTQQAYKTYIYGSAEVVGLMCLRVFTPEQKLYDRLAPGAQSLGSAFQKVNFLRDFADDWTRLGRCYFPNVTFESFDNTMLEKILKDIETDFAKAHKAIDQLPPHAKPAVQLAYNYYMKLLGTLKQQSADDIKKTRYRVPNWMKVAMYAQIRLKQGLQRG